MTFLAQENFIDVANFELFFFSSRRRHTRSTFHTVIKSGATFLYNTFPVTSTNSPNLNYTQYYTVTEKLGAATPTVLFGNRQMVPDNIGPRSTPSYAALAAQYVNSAGGYKEFTGQRDDPFFVDVNSIF